MGKVAVAETKTPEMLPSVPALALLRSPSDPYAASVFVIEGAFGDTRARIRSLRLGEFAGSRVTVLAGLKKGELVVTGGKQNLVDNALVRVTE